MKLSKEEKSARKRQRLIDKTSEMSVGTYLRKYVSKTFQRMIRAESAAYEVTQRFAVVDGNLIPVPWQKGYLTCITCGARYAWTGTNMIDTGHFISSRRNSILLLAENCAEQCKHCNRDHHGRPLEYQMWMVAVRGPKVIERLQRLKTESISFSREELVDMRISFNRRLKAAELEMKAM